MCSFWFDYWVRGVKLASVFPRIAASAQFLDVSVSNVASFSDLQSWFIPLRFQLRGGALEERHNLDRLLASIPRDHLSEGPAYISWAPQRDGKFSVSSLRRILIADKFPGLQSFPAEVVWQPDVPSKIACFSWKVFLNRIATLDSLQRKGFSLANRCVLCGLSSESVDHLFLNCVFTSEVWSLLSSKLSIHGPFPHSIVDLFYGWKGLNCLQRFAPSMKITLHSVLWFIWAERNDRIFRDMGSSPLSIFHWIWFAVGDWLSVGGGFLSIDLLTWRRLVFDNG
ncbi:Putative ribonuclease H protein At1g65750 [Linum perenne]